MTIKEAIETVEYARAFNSENSPLTSALTMVLDAAAKQEPIAPVGHGRWISWLEAGNYVDSPDRHECSVCHDAAQVLVNGCELLSTYCPNCGAKME